MEYSETNLEIVDILTNVLNYDVARIIIDEKIYLENIVKCVGCNKNKHNGNKDIKYNCTNSCDYCGNCEEKINYCSNCKYMTDYRNTPSP
jgi:hypothetical protein